MITDPEPLIKKRDCQIKTELNKYENIRTTKINIIILTTIAKNAVIGVQIPSYTSGAHI